MKKKTDTKASLSDLRKGLTKTENLSSEDKIDRLEKQNMYLRDRMSEIPVLKEV